jgi:3-oxoadipate:acetyl-CoA acetyltransferase
MINSDNELIISLAPTGMVSSKDQSSHMPLSVSEIVDVTHAAYERGITLLHLHARKPDGRPTASADVYAELIQKIRLFTPDLVICVSLSGRIDPSFETRYGPLNLEGDLKPDAGSLTLSSMNFTRTASTSSPDTIQRLAGYMQEKGILPELEIFDVGMANYTRYLITKKLIPTPCYANIILGNIASAQLELTQLGAIVHHLPSDCLWSIGGIGNAQLGANALAIAMGAGVRVGLEDNLYWDTGKSRLATNQLLVDRIHDLAEIHQRRIMSPSTFRRKLNLQAGSGHYGTCGC